VRKYRKVSVARAPLATSLKQVSVETIQVPCEPITASCEAKHAPCKPKQAPCKSKQAPRKTISVLIKNNSAPRQRIRETIKFPWEPKIASSTTMWIAKSTIPSLDPASYKAKIVLYHKITLAPRRAKSRLSSEANTKAPLCANSVADSASLPLTAPSANNLYCKVRDKAPRGANSEVTLTSLEGKAMCGKTKFEGKTKAVASPCEATLSGEAILTSPITRKKTLKAKTKASQPKGGYSFMRSYPNFAYNKKESP